MRRHRKAPRPIGRGALAVLAAAGACTLLGGWTAPPADGPELTLTSESAGPYLLTPGESAQWNLTVSAKRVSLHTLVGDARAWGTLIAAVPDATIEIVGCPSSFVAEVCAGAGTTILQPTPLAQLPSGRLPLRDARGTIPQSLHVQVRVAVPQDAAAALAGRSTDVRFTVAATGQPMGSQRVRDGAPGAMANTGSELVGPTVLALASVMAGIGVAAGASRRRSRAGSHG